jgi:hypothetical protein
MEKLIYSILSSKPPPDKLNTLLVAIKGMSGAGLYAVSLDEISAIVSDIKRTDLIADRSNAIEYAGVVETLAQQFTLIPMRFGSVMKSTGTITKMLESNYKEIRQNLQKVENKVEFGLKVFCDSEKLMTELRAKSETCTKIPAKSTSGIKNSVYKDWVNKKLKEHRLEELLLTYIDSVIVEITEDLARLKAVNKFKKMVTATNIIDAVFLLEKDKKTGLINAIKDLQNRYADLQLILTGPWPPYNFVDITIK